MKVTIIPDDKKINVDGRLIKSDSFTFDSGIHAIHWDGESGHIEYKDKRPNERIASENIVQSYIAQHTAEATKIDNKAKEPVPDPEPTQREIGIQELEQLKADQGAKALSLDYLNKKLTAIEKILGVS